MCRIRFRLNLRVLSAFSIGQRYGQPGLFSLLLVGVFASFVSGNIINSYSFEQVDWLDQDGAVHTADSSWGKLILDVAPDPTEVTYVNVLAEAGFGSSWIVQNYPVFPSSFGAPTAQSLDFNIAELGLAEGQDLSAMNVTIAVSDVSQATAPAENWTSVGVVAAIQQAWGGGYDPLPITMGEPEGHKALSDATPIAYNAGMPSVQEDQNECLPGSFARSIKWLSTKTTPANMKSMFGKNPEEVTAQDIYNELISERRMKRYVQEIPVTKRISAKNDFMKELDPRSKMWIRDVANYVDPIEGVAEDNSTDMLVWLIRQLKAKKDVELWYGKHIVTVTGIYKQGGKYFVKYRDDEYQQHTHKGDDEEKTGRIAPSKKYPGLYLFRDQPRENEKPRTQYIRVAIAETVPEPACISIIAMAGLTLLRNRKLARSA